MMRCALFDQTGNLFRNNLGNPQVFHYRSQRKEQGGVTWYGSPGITTLAIHDMYKSMLEEEVSNKKPSLSFRLRVVGLSLCSFFSAFVAWLLRLWCLAPFLILLWALIQVSPGIAQSEY